MDRWSYLIKITEARLHSSDSSDLFLTVMSSECAEALTHGIDNPSCTVALNSKDGSQPPSAFRSDKDGSNPDGLSMTRMSEIHLPTPSSMASLFHGDAEGSFRRALARIIHETRFLSG